MVSRLKRHIYTRFIDTISQIKTVQTIFATIGKKLYFFPDIKIQKTFKSLHDTNQIF